MKTTTKTGGNMNIICNKEYTMFWHGNGWVRLARNAKRYATLAGAERGRAVAKRMTTAPLAIIEFNPDTDWYLGDDSE